MGFKPAFGIFSVCLINHFRRVTFDYMPSHKAPSKPKKLRLLKKVPRSRIKNHDPRFVYLENERHGIKVPLQNEHGLLQGVFETPDKKIVEGRFKGNFYSARMEGVKIGGVDAFFERRKVRPKFRRLGVATELWELAERRFSFKHPKERLNIATGKRDTAAFFLRCGFFSPTS